MDFAASANLRFRTAIFRHYRRSKFGTPSRDASLALRQGAMTDEGQLLVLAPGRQEPGRASTEPLCAYPQQ
jgi:hypothetical protein